MAESAVMQQRRPGGRPRRVDAAGREARLLDIAGDIFLVQGFDGTAIDTVAAAAGVGKPSIYARYGDKRGLFLAVIRRRLNRWDRPFAELRPPSGGPESLDARAALEGFARGLLDGCLAADSVALLRIISAEAVRFPELAEVLYEEGWMQGVRRLASFLETVIDFPRSEVNDPALAADLFVGLVLGRVSRQALLGLAVDREALDERVKAAVAIFLGSGFLMRSAAHASQAMADDRSEACPSPRRPG